MEYTLTPKQRLAVWNPAKQLFYGGAAGGGKSYTILLKNILGVKQYADAWKGVIFRRTLKQLRDLENKAHEIYCSVGARHNANEHVFKFPNGAITEFNYLDKDRDVENYQGQEYTFIAFDELGQFRTSYAWEYMTSRNRSSRGVPCSMMGAGNPGGVGNAWIKNKWIDGFEANVNYRIPVMKNDQGGWEYITQCFIPARLDDNPFLMQDLSYKTTLHNLPYNERRALLDGDWDVIAGQVFDEWRREKHVTEPFNLDSDYWFKFYAMDWGYQDPYAIVKLAVNKYGKVIQYGEIYGCERGEVDKGTKEGSRAVADRAWKDAVVEGVKDMVADSAMWAKQNDYPSEAEDFEKAGFVMHRSVKGPGSRKTGLSVFHNYLKETDQRGSPLFQVFNTCYHTIRTLPALLPDERDCEDVDSDMEDHLYDAIRYGLTSAFAHNPQIKVARFRDASFTQTRRVYNPVKELRRRSA